MPGEAVDEERQGEDAERERNACSGGEEVGPVDAQQAGEAQAERHEPVQEWSFLQVADAVRVQRDRVVPEEHLAGDFDVDAVGVVEERGADKGEGGVENEPEEKGGEESGAGPRGYGGGHCP